MGTKLGTERWSPDGRFGLSLGGRQVERLCRLCRDAGGYETGGVLIGRYVDHHSCARISEISGPPVDSRASRTSFYRGVSGIQERLVALWRAARGFYLGEWHYHPGGAPDPSEVDTHQLLEIAASTTYNCPEPLLLIVGHNGTGKLTMRVFVFQRSGLAVELSEPTRPNVGESGMGC